MSEEATSGDEAPQGSSPARPQKDIDKKDGKRKDRIGPAQFTREVRGELKRVQWPNRREVTSYSIVVLVAVTLITIYIFGIDQAFGAFMLRIFG